MFLTRLAIQRATAISVSLKQKSYSSLKQTVMGDQNTSGKYTQDILKKLESFAPLSLAEDWDNVGLLVDPMEDAPVKNILLTNDLTEDVLDEAINLNVGLIISYHPNIFQGLKSVTSRTWKERLVVKCIRNNIAVFSPHTSWDATKGGVNDWLAAAFNLSSSSAIKPQAEDPLIGAGRLCVLSNPVAVEQAISNIKAHVGLPYLRLALARNKTENDVVSTVALCAGSGGSVLKGISADLYLTGEMLHHDILDATQKGVHVVLCNHSDSERGFLKSFQGTLRNLLDNEVGVFVSEADHDPLKTV